MQVETALLFESIEQVYARVFRTVKPKTPLPNITVRFRKYANANSRVRLEGDLLVVHISDLLEGAPAPVQEALATILLNKLFRRLPDEKVVALYRHYLNRADVRKTLHLFRQQRGRKTILPPQGEHYDLCQIFDEVNLRYFSGSLARPQLGWSMRESRTTLGHYDPSHHVIVLSNILDSESAPPVLVSYVMFHEMLHLKFPTRHTGIRRCIHTKEFKAAEREFDLYRQAQAELRGFMAKPPRATPAIKVLSRSGVGGRGERSDVL